MFICKSPEFVGMISRQKLNGFGRHVGVMLPNGLVAHMTVAGVEIVSLGDFKQGRAVSFDKRAPVERHHQMLQRAYMSVGRTGSYDLLIRNCEHFANWVMCDEPHSPQIGFALLLSFIGVLAVVAR